MFCAIQRKARLTAPYTARAGEAQGLGEDLLGCTEVSEGVYLATDAGRCDGNHQIECRPKVNLPAAVCSNRQLHSIEGEVRVTDPRPSQSLISLSVDSDRYPAAEKNSRLSTTFGPTVPASVERDSLTLEDPTAPSGREPSVGTTVGDWAGHCPLTASR